MFELISFRGFSFIFEALQNDYGKIKTYVAPQDFHSSNMIMNKHWKANKHNIQDLINGGHILHGKGEIWATEFGHYHAGLNVGENTLNSQIARVTMRVISENKGKYDSEAFLNGYHFQL